jgi:hypothetical protein
MKYRLLAGAACLGLLLATTACGSNLANSAYRVNRAYDGNVQHIAARDGSRATSRAIHHNTRNNVERAVNNTERTTGTTNHRLGNAVHNVGNATRNTTHNTTRNRNHTTRNAHTSHNLANSDTFAGEVDRAGGLNHNETRAINNSRATNTRNAVRRSTRAYNNPDNFSNTVYHEPLGTTIDGQHNTVARAETPKTNTAPTNNPGGRTMVENQNQTTRNGYLIGDTTAFDNSAMQNKNNPTATMTRNTIRNTQAIR